MTRHSCCRTQALGELAIPRSFFSSSCNVYPKNLAVTQQQDVKGASE